MALKNSIIVRHLAKAFLPGITLYRKIKEGLDSGIIVIVPIPPTTQQNDTRWKCLLIDQSRKKDMVWSGGGVTWRWEHLNEKELEFLSPNRSARRYLYFRFIITYIHAKGQGNTAWAEQVESKKVLWASPGPYLEKSMLCSLAWNISGLELPPAIYQDTTFKTDKPVKNDDDLVLASHIRDAAVSSVAKMQKAEEESDSEEDSE